MSIMFNEICINEEMLPKYTYIYLPNPSVQARCNTVSIYVEFTSLTGLNSIFLLLDWLPYLS